MKKQEAIDELIAYAVCSTTGLYCTDHCPRYKEELSDRKQREICETAATNEKIIEAVEILTGKVGAR